MSGGGSAGGGASKGGGWWSPGGGADYASATLPRHLLRGAVGFGAVGAGLGLLPVLGLPALLLVPVGLFALRGCPMCWTIGLVQTLSRGRWQRSCADGRCSIAARPEDAGR
ncbi:hypothetical protein Kpho02_02360 [Kitasatospora phosalacinea]|uniref:Uncharacterized protein n=1 Tax=Kitasatospora phosalacinea TaxID=2065 RepID=A0A9W6V066_9ACTN|nr:hypothetical protein [Kitasatospora phosalacinea]GLW67937.1 hypothetical protein Kpho02_02360 [Kitasatospora phosalacinea]